MYGLITKICECVFDRDAGKHNEYLVNTDQSYCQDFNLNEAGWIRNDISAFEMAGSESERMLFLDRLNEIKSDDKYKDLSDDEMIRFAIPRRALSDPVEYGKFVDYLSRIEYQKQKDAYDKEIEKKESESSTDVQIDGAVQTVASSPASA